MTINLQKPDIRELKPKITVFGVGGGGGNAVNNMINGGLQGVEFVVANTDAQALSINKAERVIQLGVDVTQGLGAGSQPDVGAAAAEECLTEIQDHLTGTHMCFVTAGMGGGTGTGAAPVVARAARELGILTVGVVTKPFQFEGGRRMKTAEQGIIELQKHVDTLIVIPNQNLFRIANDKTTFADAFGMADQVLYSGVACITDLMVKEGLINLDFADVRSVMRDMGKAMMGTGEASGDGRAMQAAEAAISNPLLDETSMRGAQGLLISITGGRDMTLFEVDEAATRIREEIDADANIIVGATFDESLDGIFRVSVVATGIDNSIQAAADNGHRATLTSAGAIPPRLATPAPVQAPLHAAANATAQKAPAMPAATAPAPVNRDGVRIAPMKPAAEPGDFSTDFDLDDEFRSELEKELMPEAGSFIPPAPEKPAMAATRIPPVEEFPGIARKAAAPAAKAEGEREGTPMSLLQKLKQGFGHRDDGGEAARRTEPASVSAESSPGQGGFEGAADESFAPAPAGGTAPLAGESPFAPRRAPASDVTGRNIPQRPKPAEDDQLDIPAFLRRQAN